VKNAGCVWDDKQKEWRTKMQVAFVNGRQKSVDLMARRGWGKILQLWQVL
jgi:hypothetical protein